MQQLFDVNQKQEKAPHLISIDSPDITEGTSQKLRLPKIETTGRSATPSSSKQPIYTKDDVKFLSMPMVSMNREFRSVSARKPTGAERPGRNLLKPLVGRIDSAKSAAVTSTRLVYPNNKNNSASYRPDVLERSVARAKRVREINHGKWISDVITADERSSRTASCASLRAGTEIAETQSYFESSARDTVSQVKQALADIDETCSRRLEELAEEER